VLRKNYKFLVITTILCISFLILISLNSCILPFRSLAGSGKVITEQREVSKINEVSFNAFGNLFIKQSDTESLTIEAEDNIVSNIKTDVSGNKLTISFKENFIPIPTRQIYITLNIKDLSKVSLAGAGSIVCDNLNTKDFEISSSGAGDIEFNIKAEKLMSIIKGAGGIKVSGSANNQEIQIIGAGGYTGKDLESSKCKVVITGAGSATVNVKDSLDVKISGVGSVNYIGNPEISKDISGIGSVKNINE
jgi:hypothetical protein